MKKNADNTLSLTESELLALLQRAFEAGASAESGDTTNAAWEYAEATLKRTKGDEIPGRR